MALVENLDAYEIRADWMASGIALAQHYAAEALRLRGAAQIDPKLKLAQRILEWITRHWDGPLISLPDISTV